jgi:type IV pilus assembly protein PilB
MPQTPTPTATPQGSPPIPALPAAPSLPVSQTFVQELSKHTIVPADLLQSFIAKSGGDQNMLEQLLINEGFMDEYQLQTIKANLYHWETVDLRKEFVSYDLLLLLPKNVAITQRAAPFFRDGNKVHIALTRPEATSFHRLLQKKFGSETKFFLATESSMQPVLANYDTTFHTRFASLASHEKKGEQQKDSIVDLVDVLLLHGINQGASDIHIEPGSKNSIVRERVDGLLQQSVSFSKEIHQRLTQRIKVMSNLATDEHSVPQDGKLIYWTPERKRVDVRVSIIPTTHGEKIVLRLLAEQHQEISLDSLGCIGKDKEIMEEQTKKSWGMILVTGPTGSGKSTTLYAVMQKLNSGSVNLSTIEDPVEYDMPGANQIQVNEKAGLTFANGLRSLLRQDPNIILVGEIRDKETAGISVNAAMTGHLVLSTLHTNNAGTAIPRLIDMAIEPFLLASMVNIIVAQRLVRTLCTHCAIKTTVKASELATSLDPIILKKLTEGKPEIVLYNPKGCEHCNGSGFKGRTGIFEILRISPKIRDLILKKSSAEEIERTAMEEGMTTMMDDGIAKVKMGITSINEVLRVISN